MTKPAVFFVSILLVAFSTFLPDETGGVFARYLFYPKITFLFMALIIPVLGWGWLVLAMIRNLCRCLGFLRNHKSEIDPAEQFFVGGLVGSVIIGVVSFCAFYFFRPTPLVAWLVLLCGYFLCYVYSQSELPFERVKNASAAFFRGSSRWVFALCSFALFLLFLRAFHFQGHEDSYLYHLSLSDDWIRGQTVGVLTFNIYSGYALATEHFYLLLKLISGGGYAEQNALAQLFQTLFGWTSFVYFMLRLTPVAWSSNQRLWLVLLFSQVHMTFFMVLPKNDGFHLAICALALYAVLQRRADLFIAAAAVSFATKATGAVAFATIGVCLLVLPHAFVPSSQRNRLLTQISILALATVAMLVVWLPFALHNYAVTGNPLFPLANSIFKSPFAPMDLSKVVNEMMPFSLSWDSFVASWRKMLLWQHIYLVAIALVLLSLLTGKIRILKASFFASKDDLFLLVIATACFCVFLVAMGPFGGRIEPRHYLLALAAFVVFCAAGLTRYFRSIGKEHYATLLLAILALSVAGIDARVKNVGGQILHPSITQQILAEKPLMKLNDWIEHNQAQGARLLAFSLSNTDLFRAGGEFWHPTKTYPLVTMAWRDLTAVQWRHFLAEHEISLLLLQDGMIPSGLEVLRQDSNWSKVYEDGALHLYQLQ